MNPHQHNPFGYVVGVGIFLKNQLTPSAICSKIKAFQKYIWDSYQKIQSAENTC